MCNNLCAVCGKPLSESQVIGDLKSCPNCSQNNTFNEHIFYPRDSFCYTEHRVTRNNPDGIQSHCTNCKSNSSNLNISAGIRCGNINR